MFSIRLLSIFLILNHPEIKRITVVTRGDTYVTIPYWWTGSKERHVLLFLMLF